MKRGILVCLSAAVLGMGILWAMEGAFMEEKRQFSANELAILTANGTPQERIEHNALLPSEERLLNALKHAQNYLSTRYPQDQFVFTGIDHSVLGGNAVTLFASCSDAPQESFAVRVAGESQPYEVSESHFSDIKREEVNEMVQDALVQLGIEAKCDLEIPGLYDDAYDSQLPVDILIQKGLEIPVSGWVYTQAYSKPDAEKIRNAVLELGFSGGFRLYGVQGISLKEAFALPRTQKDFIVQQEYISLPFEEKEAE